MQVSILDISLHTSGEGYVDYGATIKKGTQDCETNYISGSICTWSKARWVQMSKCLQITRDR